MNDAALVVALANARAARRPTHARRAVEHDALADVSGTNALLEPFLDHPVDARELASVNALQRAVMSIADALIDGTPPPVEALNALAAREPAIQALERHANGKLHATVRPKRTNNVATLIFAVICELSEIEPSRLRRCARPECRLVFYDISRSATQRWHADRPCGLRERQRRHRARRAA